MNAYLERICQGDSLSQDESYHLFNNIISGKMDSHLVAAILTALKIKGESTPEITGAALALRQAAKPFARPVGNIADIVGTGGDGTHTINISSTSVFVVAAAGITVCKHGNRSVSSKSGSADVLQELGINIEMTPDQTAKSLTTTGACFIFAPQYHPGVRHVMDVRRALKTRTIFNILGPLINPARPDVMLIGVYSNDLLLPIANVLPSLGVNRAMVVYGSGMDEICLHGPTDVVEVTQGQIKQYQLTPEKMGLRSATLEDLKGGEPIQNAMISRDILAGHGTTANVHAIAANAGSLIYLAGKAKSVKQGVDSALEIIQSGVALAVLESLVKPSHD